jgi:hypothetical protein
LGSLGKSLQATEMLRLNCFCQASG